MGFWAMEIAHTYERVVTRMDTPKYGETLKIYVCKVPTDLSSLTKGLPSLIME